MIIVIKNSIADIMIVCPAVIPTDISNDQDNHYQTQLCLESTSRYNWTKQLQRLTTLIKLEVPEMIADSILISAKKASLEHGHIKWQAIKAFELSPQVGLHAVQ